MRQIIPGTDIDPQQLQKQLDTQHEDGLNKYILI